MTLDLALKLKAAEFPFEWCGNLKHCDPEICFPHLDELLDAVRPFRFLEKNEDRWTGAAGDHLAYAEDAESAVAKLFLLQNEA